MHNIHKAIATIILLVVVGLVGVQGSQLLRDAAPSNFDTQCLINLIIIIIGVKHTESSSMRCDKNEEQNHMWNDALNQ